MRRAHASRTTAFLLCALSGVLSTGLPSHHHDAPAPADTDVGAVSADHHSHGTQLVEQDERTPSGAPHLAVPSPSDIDLPTPASAVIAPVAVRLLRPTERAPPPGAPRAPPHPA